MQAFGLTTSKDLELELAFDSIGKMRITRIAKRRNKENFDIGGEILNTKTACSAKSCSKQTYTGVKTTDILAGL